MTTLVRVIRAPFDYANNNWEVGNEVEMLDAEAELLSSAQLVEILGAIHPRTGEITKRSTVPRTRSAC